MKFARGVFYEKFAAVKEQICFFFLLVTMKAAPHPFLYAVFRARSARCLWAFYGRSDAAISRTAFKAKTPAQSSRSGVIATIKRI